MLTMFDYQERGLEMLRDGFRNRHRRGLLCMLMGAGKTLVALNMMRLTAEKGRKSLFLCDRRMLAEQAVERARDEGLDAGLLMAGRGHDLGASCQFASKDTLVSWLKKGSVNLPQFHLVVTDECHRAVSKTWETLRALWGSAYHVGLSATPCLGNGRGLGAYYDFLCQPVKPSELLALGRTVRVRAFEPHVPDVSGCRKGKDGDYQTKALSSLMNRSNLVGDVPGWWKRLAENRPSVYFACDVSHAVSIRDSFLAEGVPCEVVCDETPDGERDDIRRHSKSGKTLVVVNCDVLAEGIDWPWVSCIGLVRPTKRLRRYLQSSGRGMRACEGKGDMLLLDHAGCVRYHGFPDIDHDWPLAAEDTVGGAKPGRPNEPNVYRCAKCTALISGTRKCPECGHLHVPTRVAKDQGRGDGVLIEATREELEPELQATLYKRFWPVCIGAAIKRHAKAGMAAKMFSEKFGIPPWQAGVTPLPAGRGDWKLPACEVFPGYVRSQTVEF